MTSRTADTLPDRTRASNAQPLRRGTRRIAGWIAIGCLLELLCLPVAVRAQLVSGPAAAEPGGEALQSRLEQPVRFRGETLFFVRAPVATLSIEERARAIEQRMLAASVLPADSLEQLRSENRLEATDLMIGEHLLISVQDADARPVGRSRQQLAADYELIAHAALAHEFSSRSARGLLTGSLFTLLATAVFALLIRYLLRLHRLLVRTVPAVVRRRIGSVRIGQLELVPAEEIEQTARSLLRLTTGLIFGLLFYVYLQRSLGFFPWTRGLADQLVVLGTGALTWVGSGIWTYLPNLVYVAIIAAVTYFTLRASRFLFREIEQGHLVISGFYQEWAVPTYKILRVLVCAFAIVVAFPYLPGSDSPGFQGVSVFLGVLLSLGSVSAVGNAVSGIVLTYMRPFRVGDRVRIAETTGDVLSKDALTVRIRTIKNVEVTVPNSAVLSHHIENYSAVARDRGLILHTKVTIGYAVPWRQVHELLLTAARNVEGIQEEPAPFILQTALDDFYVHYELNAYTARANQMAQLYARLHEQIQDGFHAAGVEIMSPHYTAARDGNRTEIPDEHLPADYQPAAFRLFQIAPGKPEQRGQ